MEYIWPDVVNFAIIDPLEAKSNRPKRQSQCPPQKISSPDKIFWEFQGPSICQHWSVGIGSEERPLSRCDWRWWPWCWPPPSAAGAGCGRGHGRPCSLHHPKGRILLSTMTRIVCVGSLLCCQTTKATGDHGGRHGGGGGSSSGRPPTSRQTGATNTNTETARISLNMPNY